MDLVASSNEEYSTKAYWERRYESESLDASFDWFKSYNDIRPLIRELIPHHDAKILMLGCGNSTLSGDMWQDGFHNITNVDYSSVLIEKMREKYAEHQEMQWMIMDVRDLKFEDESFDVAIDKGTMDAMMAVKGDVWNPPEQVVQDCTKEVQEVMRVLKPSGKFLYLTFGQPHFRKRYLNEPGTELEIRQLGEAFHYYLYVMSKNVNRVEL